jgi:hypothetical protein
MNTLAYKLTLYIMLMNTLGYKSIH